MLDAGLLGNSANFRLYYAGQATSAVGNGLVPVVFAFAALQVVPRGGLIPVVLLALWVSRMALLPLGSVFAERRSKASVMLFADVGRLGAQLVAAIPFGYGEGAAWQLIVSAAIYGACTAFFAPASYAILPKLVGQELLQRANALLGVAYNFGLVVGPALGGLLVAGGGVALALFFDVGTFAVSVMTLAVLRTRFGDATASAPEADSVAAVRFWDGVRIIPRVRGVLGVLALYCVVQFSAASVGVLGPIIASQSLGGIGAWSTIVTAMAVGALVGGAAATRFEIRNTVGWALVAFGLFTPIELFVIAIPFGVWVIVGVFLCTTVVTEVAGVSFDTYVQRSVPPEYLARVGAVESGLLGVMNPIGVAAAFPLASVFGVPGFLIGVGVMVLITALCVAISVYRFKAHGREGDLEKVNAAL
ncbi:MFS transporter [Mycobacteroides salmoniphilum]|uniref:MFS transporter n=1 Tax=Mycobacteroides salmoniphilum TaxID=404941 RepID=UPI001064C614|nr:MFS transporter [Mycobacteroides salmoniphilum]TDZ77128.1 putative bacilysin exporter BacE [Mycobacteroides salmoniphilum]TDZ86831.1 putative bacilysin exporter BacE [Mycobacteroides salmoniphilum]